MPAVDDEVLDAVERLEVEVAAERGLGHRQVQVVEQVVAVALEALVGPHPHVDVEVARRGRRGARPRPRPVRRTARPSSMPAGISTV